MVEKYRSYVWSSFETKYDSTYKSYFQSAVFDHFYEITKVKQYPTKQVEELCNEYIEEVNKQFTSTGGKIMNIYTGAYQTYPTLDAYAPAYLGLSSTSDITWREYLYSMAESLIKERLIMFYLMREEGFAPSEDDFEKLLNATREEYIETYIQQYLDYEGKTKEDYTDAEYEQFVKERKSEISSYYDDRYFEEITYYNIVVKHITEWDGIEVVTLDDRRAYPLDK